MKYRYKAPQIMNGMINKTIPFICSLIVFTQTLQAQSTAVHNIKSPNVAAMERFGQVSINSRHSTANNFRFQIASSLKMTDYLKIK